MKKTYSLIAIFICLLVTPDLLYGQSAIMEEFNELRNTIVEKQKNTRAEIERLNKKISEFEQRLQQAEEKYEALYQKYQNLKQLIALQDEKISQLKQEQSQIQEEIAITTKSLSAKRAELKKLVENYKQTLSYLYKHGRTSQLALIFSASSINQMLIRSFYLEKFNNYREQQALEIREAEQELERTKQQLVKAQQKNKEVLEEIRNEKQKLAQKKEQQEKNVALLRENREEINKKLKEVQQQKDNLNSTLTDLIRREKEIRKAREQKLRQLEAERKKKLAAAKKIENDAKRAAEVEKYSEPIKLDNFLDSNKMEEIEQQFASKKGKLPWPVDSRTITEHFGNKVHPVYGTKTPNLGIEIVADAQSSVEAVHEGYVMNIRPVPGYGEMILINHGRFITAYGNLSEIMVRKNEVLSQGDMIGLSGDEDSPKGEILFFLIRENNENLDPENWLRRETMSSNY